MYLRFRSRRLFWHERRSERVLSFVPLAFMGGVISGSISLLRSVYMAGDLASMTAGGTVRGYTRLFFSVLYI